MLDPHSASSLRQFLQSHAEPNLSRYTREKRAAAFDHLERLLGRDPAIADLTAANFDLVIELRRREGCQLVTLERLRHALQGIATAAANAGLLVAAVRVSSVMPRKEPRVPKRKPARKTRKAKKTPEPHNGRRPSRPRRKSSRSTSDFVGLIRIDNGRTLRHVFEHHYRPQRLPDNNEMTNAKYLHSIDTYSRFCGCDATVDSLTDEMLERFMSWCKLSGMANTTCNTQRAHLLAIWNFAWKKRLTNEAHRDVPKYRVAKRVPEAWSVRQIEMILAAAAQTPGTLCGIPACHWWPALILTLYDTGLRIAAVLKLRTHDLSDERWLTVPAGIQKNKAEQVFGLAEDTMAAILATDPHRREWLFPWPFDSEGNYGRLQKHYSKILVRAGLPHGRRDKFHKIRRTSATLVCDAVDEHEAQRHLGHSSLSVTRSYIDPRRMKKTKVAAELIQRPQWQSPAEAGTTSDEGGELKPPHRPR
jgi:integrase